MTLNTKPMKEKAEKSWFGGTGIVVLECGAMDKNDGNGSALELITGQRVELLGLGEP
jgi:hypothetical protein